MSEKTQEEFIYLTQPAHRHIRDCLVDGFHIRVSVKGGGCSGLTYVCEAEEREKKDDNDIVIPYDSFDILIDKKSMIYLKGMELDYDGGLGGTGFKFSNPLATSTCGCGESFSI